MICKLNQYKVCDQNIFYPPGGVKNWEKNNIVYFIPTDVYTKIMYGFGGLQLKKKLPHSRESLGGSNFFNNIAKK